MKCFLKSGETMTNNLHSFADLADLILIMASYFYVMDV